MLTREKVLSMNPGRELDALVAEKVMGWKQVEEFAEMFDREGFLLGTTTWRDDEGDPAFLPEYSTDISATWEVIEKFEGYKIWKSPFSDSFYEVILLTKSSSYIARGTSFPEVVCKAALLAVMDGDE